MKLRLKAEHTKYFLKSGEQVPGVTSTQKVWAKEAFYNWYPDEERKGILAAMGDGVWSAERLATVLPVTKNGKPAWYANIKRDAGADLGKVAHAHVEAHYKQDVLEMDGIDPVLWNQGKMIADEYIKRLESEHFLCTQSEYVMVDEELRVGGTGDRFGTIGTHVVYRDLKTSKPWFDGLPYNETVAQSCGYALMYEKLHGDRVSRIFIDRIGKTISDKGDFWELTTAQRKAGEKWFHLGVEAYYCDRDIRDALSEERSVAR